jgi:hypothetical protein
VFFIITWYTFHLYCVVIFVIILTCIPNSFVTEKKIGLYVVCQSMKRVIKESMNHEYDLPFLFKCGGRRDN